MKKKILTSLLLIGLMASGISILAPASYAAQKLTRKQKKENTNYNCNLDYMN